MHTLILPGQLFYLLRCSVLRTVIDKQKLQVCLFFPEKGFVLYKLLIEISNIFLFVITRHDCAE